MLTKLLQFVTELNSHISGPLKFNAKFLSVCFAAVSRSQNNVCLLANRFVVINANTTCIGHESHGPTHIAGYHSTIICVMQQHCLCRPSDVPHTAEDSDTSMFNCRPTQRKRLRESHWLQCSLISCSGLFILCVHERWNHDKAMHVPMPFVGACGDQALMQQTESQARNRTKFWNQSTHQHCLFLCHALLFFSLSLSYPPGRSQCPTAVITDELKTFIQEPVNAQTM